MLWWSKISRLFEDNKKMEVILYIFIFLTYTMSHVHCETTLPPMEETTTEEATTIDPVINTTSLGPLQEIDFRMNSIVGNFFVDVNFTEIEGDPNSVNMIVKVNAAPNTEPSRYIREKLLGIYLLNLPNCDGLDISTLQPARLLSPLNKVGEESVKIKDLSISSLLSLNCLIVAASNCTYKQIFTSTSTSTLPTTTTELIETTLPTITRHLSVGRKLTQLGSQLTESDNKIGQTSALMKHQYDVKKIAQQVDHDEDFPDSETDEKESNSIELGPDYYDPEDLNDDDNLEFEENEKEDDSIDSSLGIGNPGIEIDPNLDEGFGLDTRPSDIYRKSGCQAGREFERISLLDGQQQPLTRTFTLTSFALVLSSGSVSLGSSPTINSHSPGIVYFNSGASFNFNPFANWPVVVLQGFYVLATYGTIIIWALVLGAIIWGISLSPIFSARRVGLVASEVVYRPVERLTSMVHNGIERFSHLNRRNYRKRRPLTSSFYHRNDHFDYDENFYFDYEEKWQNF